MIVRADSVAERFNSWLHGEWKKDHGYMGDGRPYKPSVTAKLQSDNV